LEESCSPSVASMVAVVSLVFSGVAVAAANEFVPACMAKQCANEALALGNDTYSTAFGSCVATNFGPCAADAWECLGDSKCQQALQCGPKVLDKCGDSIWAMMTDEKERKKITCMMDCMKDGKINPLCVATKCGAAAIECLADSTCMKAALCIPEAVLGCSGEAFGCIFGTDKVCQKNLVCLGHGVSECAGPSVNMLTDTKIADFVTCAGKSCPHPAPPHHNHTDEHDEDALLPATVVEKNADGNESGEAAWTEGATPHNTAEQLLCMAAKCSAKTLDILRDQDTKDLVQCLLQDDLPDLCPAAWDCLADDDCREAVTCWSAPFQTCSSDIWTVLTDAQQRQRIETAVSCIRDCEEQHRDDFVDATFCVLDTCSQAVLDCNQDDTCREAVKCVPKTVGQCALPQTQAYLQNELLNKATKCAGRGLELCGAAAVEMLRNDDIAAAVTCASQCTIPPTSVLLV